MRTILRKVTDGLYFQGPGKWTSNPAEAMDFKLIDRALEFIKNWNLKGVELVFAFKGAKKITRVPPEKVQTQYQES